MPPTLMGLSYYPGLSNYLQTVSVIHEAINRRHEPVTSGIFSNSGDSYGV